MSIRIDHVDKNILKTLRANSRTSFRELARKLGIPPSTMHDRVKRLEKQGVITSYTIGINYRLIGYQVKALILVNVIGEHIIEVEKEIAKNPNVQAVYDITGEYDIAVLVSFKTIEELDHFVKKLLKNPYIKQTRTSIVFRTIKENLHLPID